MNSYDIIIVGAGASGLMAARELSKAGKEVLVLEARERIGGRIWPLDADVFGYPAQGGAEFVHGEAPITRVLIKEAGLHFVPEEGEIWTTRNGTFERHMPFVTGNHILAEKLALLTKDTSLAEFLRMYFSAEEYASLRNLVTKVAEGYDAADPEKISVFALREGWLGRTSEGSVSDGWIKEGYGALLDFLRKGCDACGAGIILNSIVHSIEVDGDMVTVKAGDRAYTARSVIVTVPLPLLKDIRFNVDVSEQFAAVEKIGFGQAIKLVMKFKTRWWHTVHGGDLRTMGFLRTNEPFLTWWTQYPLEVPVLVGWMSGPQAALHSGKTPQELLELALGSLARALAVDSGSLRDELVSYVSANWPADPFAKGAYSYTTYLTGDAYEKAAKPIGDHIFFAGEALCSGSAGSTVEGALESGREAAKRILSEAL